MIEIAGRSAWSFETSGTGGVGIEFVALEGGVIDLTDPRHNPVRLRLAAAGVGVTYGFKLPKIGKLPGAHIGGKKVGGAAAPTFFPNAGRIWKTRACAGPELTHADFCGPVVFVEGGASLIVPAIVGDIMLMGFDKLAYVEAAAASGTPILSQLMQDRALSTVKAILMSAGLSATFGAEAGVALLTGAVW